MSSLSNSFSLLAAALLLSTQVQAAPAPATDAHSIERGRYLVKLGGCNDCHTPGYAERGGVVPERQWLTGSDLGWQGPWGTTYASNLRLVMTRMSEAQWLQLARTARYRPPMPWFNLHAMTERDLRAIYRFVHHLGPAGTPAPAYVPPGGPVHTAVIRFPEPPKG